MQKDMDTLGLLKKLVSIPSFSREEGPACDFLEGWMKEAGLGEVHRIGNNLWVESSPADDRPVILLNAPSTLSDPHRATPVTPSAQPRKTVVYMASEPTTTVAPWRLSFRFMPF